MANNGKLDYDGELRKLQVELNRIARLVQDDGKRVLVIVEGRDTAGKGGVISAIKAFMAAPGTFSRASLRPTRSLA